MSEKEETVTITRHFTVDMEKYAARRKTEASIPDDAEGADESDELDEAEARRMVKRLLVEGPRNEYNATVKNYGLRKLPIDLDTLFCSGSGTGEGCYPAWFWGCVDDLGKVESIVANTDEHDEDERYWLKTATGAYWIDLDCDPAFACSGFVRVALPSCANAYAYYFDPQITAAFINANRGAFKRLNAPEESEIPPSGLEIPSESESWRIIAETAADWGVNSRDWERFGIVTATTWVNKDGEVLYDPAKGDYRLDQRIMRLENRIMMLNSCCWLSDLVSTGERCLKMASLAQDFAKQREPHYRRLAEWIEKEVKPRAKTNRSYEAPTGMRAFPLKCYRGEKVNPYFGKDDDLSMIWLLELYWREDARTTLSAGKCEFDHGRCDRAILKSNVPYGMKIAAAALEEAMKELDERLELDPESHPRCDGDDDDIYPITEDDCFYPFIDQWHYDEFPWEKYLALPTIDR